MNQNSLKKKLLLIMILSSGLIGGLISSYAESHAARVQAVEQTKNVAGTVTDENGYFSTDGGSVAVRGGDCESNAVLFKVGETKTFKLISEYNEEYGVYYDNWGVAYFKFTALKGKGYEMIVCSDSPDAMLDGDIFPSKDSDCWWGSGREVDELDDGSILLRIPAYEWEEEDPRAVLAIGLVSGDVGTRVKVELRQIP